MGKVGKDQLGNLHRIISSRAMVIPAAYVFHMLSRKYDL